MKKQTQYVAPFSCITILSILCASALLPRTALGHEPGAHPQNGSARQAEDAYKSEVTIEVRGGFRYIQSNGIPDHPRGQFPNWGNPNAVAPQNHRFRVPLVPKAAKQVTSALGHPFGVAINGVTFDPGTAELWNGDPRWRYEALSGVMATRGGLGMDENLAHVQPNGAYHYHGLPMGLLKKLNYQKKMVLVGYAADGFPIYGPYAYATVTNPKSPLKKLQSSYRIKKGARPGGSTGPGGVYDGSFAQDYEYVKGLGDLDACNGRTGVTPEYPKGTYYYVLTDSWPFVPRQYKGTPDSSFLRQGPGGRIGAGGKQDGIRRPPPFVGPGPGGPVGPPPGFVPADILASYLNLTGAQKERLDRLIKTVEALRGEHFALHAFAALRLTDAQIRRIAGGETVRAVLNDQQRRILGENQRPGFGRPGGPGGFGGPGGPPAPEF